jgi:hypothetical protein
MRSRNVGALLGIASALSALHGGGSYGGKVVIGRRERNDPERLARAVAKRERKAAKRLADGSIARCAPSADVGREKP